MTIEAVRLNSCVPASAEVIDGDIDADTMLITVKALEAAMDVDSGNSAAKQVEGTGVDGAMVTQDVHEGDIVDFSWSWSVNFPFRRRFWE